MMFSGLLWWGPLLLKELQASLCWEAKRAWKIGPQLNCSMMAMDTKCHLDLGGHQETGLLKTQLIGRVLMSSVWCKYVSRGRWIVKNGSYSRSCLILQQTAPFPFYVQIVFQHRHQTVGESLPLHLEPTPLHHVTPPRPIFMCSVYSRCRPKVSSCFFIRI